MGENERASSAPLRGAPRPGNCCFSCIFTHRRLSVSTYKWLYVACKLVTGPYNSYKHLLNISGRQVFGRFWGRNRTPRTRFQMWNASAAIKSDLAFLYFLYFVFRCFLMLLTLLGRFRGRIRMPRVGSSPLSYLHLVWTSGGSMFAFCYFLYDILWFLCDLSMAFVWLSMVFVWCSVVFVWLSTLLYSTLLYSTLLYTLYSILYTLLYLPT